MILMCEHPTPNRHDKRAAFLSVAAVVVMSALVAFAVSRSAVWQRFARQNFPHTSHSRASLAKPSTPPGDRTAPALRLVDAAVEQIGVTVEYDPAYIVLKFPNGDVPAHTGVCSDVVVRAFRSLDIDLQKELNADMHRNFALYPRKWKLNKPDANIDHRRVPNLMTYFARQGKSLTTTTDPRDYKPGDVVAWDLGGGLTHTGIVSDTASTTDAKRFQIVHNIGAGAQMEDRLFEWKIIGHYRYF